MLKSDLCDYSDVYIIVKGDITVTNPASDAYDKKLAFKNNEPFISCISKINNKLIDNAEYLDIVMPITICLNTVKMIEKQQEVYEIITEMNQTVEQKEA